MYAEVLGAEGRFWAKCLASGRVRRIFDSELRAGAISLSGGRLCLPRIPGQSLAMRGFFLIFGLLIPTGPVFTLEIGLTDTNNSKKILVFAQGSEVIRTERTARIPNA